MINISPFSFLIKENGSNYNAKFDRIPRNHDYYKDIRSRMLKGERDQRCRQCWVHEDSGMISNRMAANSHYYPELMGKACELTKEDGTINPDDFPIRYYDLRLGNLCNSRCIICNENNSSMWGKVIDWSGGKLETPYLKELIENAEHIDRIYLTGGEPMVSKNHWQLLDLLIEKGYSKNINLDYNSNGVLMKKEFLEKWKHFKNVGIGFSIDGIGEVYEKIRYPSKWESVAKNLQLFNDFAGENTHASFAMTILSLNILNVIDLFKWYYNKKFTKIQLEPHFNILSRPLQLDIRRIHLEQKHIIKSEYERFYKWMDRNCEGEEIPAVKRNFSGVINAMYTEPLDND
jgi:sulfatase maturation enzyme AslB (radical SAM superfamily)